MKGGSKKKGSSYERDLSKYLTDWMGGNHKKQYFIWRTPSSGGILTKCHTQTQMAGDLISCHPNSEFFFNKVTIEAKHGYKDAVFDKLISQNKNKTILDFHLQSTRDAKLSNKYSMVIYKNGTTNWVSVEVEFIENYIKFDKSLLDLNKIKFEGNYKSEYCDLYFFNFEEFFKSITPEGIKSMSKPKPFEQVSKGELSSVEIEESVKNVLTDLC